jgi:ABC-type phosphate/phosphonate transport system substrate-binding protein
MAIFQRTTLAFFIAFVAFHSPPTASAERAVQAFRIGLIGADPRQLLQDFDPFVEYLRNNLRHSGISDVTVFVARDLDQLSSRIQKGRLDFVLTSAYPAARMEGHELVPAVVVLQGSAREESAVFFVRKESSLQDLGDLREKTIVFSTPWSTAGYALAKAELYKNELYLSESTDRVAPDDAVRYTFAGEPINQAFRVIRYRADAGVFSSSKWDALPPAAQSRLRIIHRTRPVIRLLGSFHPSFPPAQKEAVEQTLVAMSETGDGRTALAKALNAARFERLTGEDSIALERFTVELSDGTE